MSVRMTDPLSRHLGNASEERRAAAEKARLRAWEEAQPLLRRGRAGDAYHLMRRACRQAWQLEQPPQ